MIAFSVGAGYSSVPLFVSDISSDRFFDELFFPEFVILSNQFHFRNRGILCSINHLTNCIANLVGLCASLYLDYHQFAKCAIFVPLIFFVLMSFVPDSPSSLRRLERFEVNYFHKTCDDDVLAIYRKRKNRFIITKASVHRWKPKNSLNK